MGLRSKKKYSNRQPQENDAEQFRELIQENFHGVKWFSFKAQDKSNSESISLFFANLFKLRKFDQIIGISTHWSLYLFFEKLF